MARKLLGSALCVAGALAVLLPFQNCAPGFSVGSDTQSSLGFLPGQAQGTVADLNKPSAFGQNGMRRLSSTELTASLNDIFGVDPSPVADQLPADIAGNIYFDNAYQSASVSSLVIAGYDLFTDLYAPMVASTPGLVTRVAGCTPSSANDRVCYLKFVQKVGRRMLRRPVTTLEANTYADAILPYAADDQTFDTAVQMTVQLFTSHPEFLYRVEGGIGSSNVSGFVQLNSFEVASRMAFLLWGMGPDETLLDAAANNQLATPQQRETQALRMLADVKGKRSWERFHAQWFGYATHYMGALDADYQQESKALIDRVVFERDSDWMDIYRSDETYVTPALAQKYGLPVPTATSWVKYPANRGGGVFSHGLFASVGAKFADTSPTRRGYEIYKRVTCGKFTATIPPGVDVDNPPGTPTDCKPVRYSMRSISSCATCHNIIDNIGFGLENVGPAGQWRTTEPTNTSCSIAGTGSIGGTSFVGPRELGLLVSNSNDAELCASRQLFRYMMGRMDDPEDNVTVQGLYAQYKQTPSLKSLLVSLVKTPAILYRKDI